MPLNKYKDYFTSALPSPQKAEDVLLPLAGIAPLTPSGPAAVEFSKLIAGFPTSVPQSGNVSFVQDPGDTRQAELLLDGKIPQ